MELYQHIWMENLDLAFSLCIHTFVYFCISAFHSVLPLPHFSPSLSFCCLQCFSLSLFSPKIFLSLLFDTHFSFIPFLFASLHISMLLLLSTKTWRWCCWGEMMSWTHNTPKTSQSHEISGGTQPCSAFKHQSAVLRDNFLPANQFGDFCGRLCEVQEAAAETEKVQPRISAVPGWKIPLLTWEAPISHPHLQW